MFSVTYEGVDGTRWHLAGPDRGAEGVQLASIEQLVGAVSVSTTPGPGRVGVIRTGLPRVSEMAGGVPVIICGADATPQQPTFEAMRAFRRAWSQLTPGVLELGSVDSSILRARVWLAEPLAPPVNDPYDSPVQRHNLAVPIVADAGYWSGPRQEYEGIGAPVEIYNRGDLQVWPVVSWEGAGPTITGPGVAPLVLPTAPEGAQIDLNPATGTVITVDGEPAPELWSQLRGRSFPTGIPPRGTAVWTFSAGAMATVTPRVLDPWSW